MTLFFTHDAPPGVGGGAGLGAESEFMALALRGGGTLFWSVARGQLPMTDKVELAPVKSTFAQNIQPKLLKIKQSHQPESVQLDAMRHSTQSTDIQPPAQTV